MLNQAPHSWTIDSLLKAANEGPHTLVNGRWEPSRPYGYFSLRNRARLAWQVFTGRADALFWPNQNPKAY